MSGLTTKSKPRWVESDESPESGGTSRSSLRVPVLSCLPPQATHSDPLRPTNFDRVRGLRQGPCQWPRGAASPRFRPEGPMVVRLCTTLPDSHPHIEYKGSPRMPVGEKFLVEGPARKTRGRLVRRVVAPRPVRLSQDGPSVSWDPFRLLSVVTHGRSKGSWYKRLCRGCPLLNVSWISKTPDRPETFSRKVTTGPSSGLDTTS